MIIMLLCALFSAFAFAAAGDPVNVLDLGVRNDGSADISAIVNEATRRHALYFPAGLYRVGHPLRLKNPIRGEGYARIPEITSARTWFLSEISCTNASESVIEIAGDVRVNVENINLYCKSGENGISIFCRQDRHAFIDKVGIFNVSACGLNVGGGGSRPVYAGNMSIFGSKENPQQSTGVRIKGPVDCRLSNMEIISVCVGIEAQSGHIYGDNIHVWTGIWGDEKNCDWWKNTRSIVLGEGANFAGSQIYPDTSYYVIDQVGDGAICEISNIMFWEDFSVRHFKERTGTFYHRESGMTGKLILNGGLIGIEGCEEKPNCITVYTPGEEIRGVMLKSDYPIHPRNLDRLCVGDALPDYRVQYADKGYCKVADILIDAETGVCEGRLTLDDGAVWDVSCKKGPDGVVVSKTVAGNDLCRNRIVSAIEEEGVVKVFFKTETNSPVSFRFTTTTMTPRFRPIDHGSLRTMKGKSRCREVRDILDGVGGTDAVRVLFDTDMITDFDDVGALACLHAMADAGECEILATVSSTRGNASVAAIEVINGYYGRGDLPVGAPKGMGVMGAYAGAKEKVDPKSPLVASDAAKRLHEGDHYKYRKLAADYPQWVKHLDADDAPDANLVYRRALASVPDKSVVICSVGFLTNLRRLLETKADYISPLDGRTLVAKKVKGLVAMACAYPKGHEYNAMWDAESSRIVFERWPTEIVFSDWQYGGDLFAGRAIAEMPGPRNPVKDVFIGNIPSREEIREDPVRWQRNCYGMGGRAAWDETAVLAAVRGTDSYFNVHCGTYRMIGSDGEDEWVPDEENGPHMRLTEKISKIEIGKMIDELICRGPLRK